MWRSYLADIRFLTRKVVTRHPVMIVVAVVLALAQGQLPGLQVWLNKMVIDRLTNTSGLGVSALVVTFMLIGGQYLTTVGMGLLNIGEGYLRTFMTADLVYDLQRQLGLISSQLPFEFFEHHTSYQQLQLAREGTTESVHVLAGLLELIRSLFTLSSVVTVLTLVHWSLPLLMVAASLPGILVLLLVRNRFYTMQVDQIPVVREADYTYRLLMDRQSLKEVRVFDLGDYLLNRWSKLTLSLRHFQIAAQVRESLAGVLGQLLVVTTSIAIACYLAWGISHGTLMVGDYVALTGAILLIQGTLGSLGASLSRVYQNMKKVRILCSFLQEEAATTHEPDRRKLPFPHSLTTGIRCEHLGYTYPGTERPVLTDVSLAIRPGERVAIVGPNGAGKTTLALCLLGLLRPSTGRILFDGVDAAAITLDSLAQNVTAVFQDFVRYRYTLRENVGFGRMADMHNNERLDQIAVSTGLIPLLRRLPFGWDTRLGKEFPGGHDVSGGEWQRIGIARALTSEAQVVFLDEPTAALDPHAELDVFHQFAELSRGRTSLMISHRLGPARLADRILVLSTGRLVEQGTHQQLMALDGLYASMFRAQASWYQEFPETLEA